MYFADKIKSVPSTRQLNVPKLNYVNIAFTIEPKYQYEIY